MVAFKRSSLLSGCLVKDGGRVDDSIERDRTLVDLDSCERFFCRVCFWYSSTHSHIVSEQAIISVVLKERCRFKLLRSICIVVLGSRNLISRASSGLSDFVEKRSEFPRGVTISLSKWTSPLASECFLDLESAFVGEWKDALVDGENADSLEPS